MVGGVDSSFLVSSGGLLPSAGLVSAGGCSVGVEGLFSFSFAGSWVVSVGRWPKRRRCGRLPDSWRVGG